MRVNTIRIPCKDLEKSENFYTNKLGFEKLFGSTKEGFIGFALENAQLIIEPEEPGEFEAGRFLGFSLEVEDIKSFFEIKKSEGVIFVGGLEELPWGFMTHVADPSGNSFTIIQC